MAENTNTALLTTLERMANHAESHRETTSHSYQALQRAYEEDRNAVDAVAKMIAERDALAAEVKALREDAERWQEVARRYDASTTSRAVMVLQGLGMEETPYRSFAENIDAARASAATGGGNG